MNDLSRLCLTVSNKKKNQPSKLKDIFNINLKDYLLSEQIPESLINSYLNNCNEVIITKTDSRSVLSTLNEIMLIMKSLEEDKEGFKDLNERNKWNNRFMYKPINYEKPIKVFTLELENRYKFID